MPLDIQLILYIILLRFSDLQFFNFQTCFSRLHILRLHGK